MTSAKDLQNVTALVAAIFNQARRDYIENPKLRIGIEAFYNSQWFVTLAPTGTNQEHALASLRASIRS